MSSRLTPYRAVVTHFSFLFLIMTATAALTASPPPPRAPAPRERTKHITEIFRGKSHFLMKTCLIFSKSSREGFCKLTAIFTDQKGRDTDQ